VERTSFQVIAIPTAGQDQIAFFLSATEESKQTTSSDFLGDLLSDCDARLLVGLSHVFL
jgi:hypothetical protein